MNQMTESLSVLEIADAVQEITDCSIVPIPNPRKEEESHYYNPTYTSLRDLGLEPHLMTTEVLSDMIEWVEGHKQNADRECIMPKVKWRQ